MKVGSVTDLAHYREFIDDRIDDDDKLDDGEIKDIVAAIDNLPKDDRQQAIQELLKSPDRLPESERPEARRAIAQALKDHDRRLLMADPTTPANKARNSDAYMPSEKLVNYVPNKDGVKLEVPVSDHVSAILDTGRQNGVAFAKTGVKFDSEHLTAYGVYDVAAPVTGSIDAGFKLKTSHWFLLGETNTLAETNARLYRGYTGIDVNALGSNLQAGAFAGYVKGMGLGSRYSGGYGEYDLGVVGLNAELTGKYHPTHALTLGYNLGGSLTTGEGLKYPDGVEKRLDFSQNGHVDRLPITNTPIDSGIWAGLAADEEHATVEADYQVTDKFGMGFTVKGHTYGLQTAETPAIAVDLQSRAHYDVAKDTTIEAGVQTPVVNPFYYKPTIYNLGLQAGPNLFVGGHVATVGTKADGSGAALDSVGGTVAIMPDDRVWNVNASVNADRYGTTGTIGLSFDTDSIFYPQLRRQRAEAKRQGQSAAQAPPRETKIEAYSSHRHDPTIFPVAEQGYNRSVVPVSAQDPKATFETVVKALSTPEQVAGYDNDFIAYDRNRPNGATYTPRVTFDKKNGVCRDHSRFQAYVLGQHGYRAWSLEYAGAQVYHSICVYQDFGGRWNAIEYGTSYRVGADSFESLCASLQKHFTDTNKYTVNWMEAEMVTVDDRQSILQVRSPGVNEILDRVSSKDLKY